MYCAESMQSRIGWTGRPFVYIKYPVIYMFLIFLPSEAEKMRRWQEIKIRQHRLLAEADQTQPAHIEQIMKSGFTMSDIKGWFCLCQIGCPETSVRNYLHKTTKEHRSHLCHGRCLKLPGWLTLICLQCATQLSYFCSGWEKSDCMSVVHFKINRYYCCTLND
jgi:hypothetical protein